MAGAYEREAIRPHVLGRFGDMLLAAEGHPAMLLYLDNARSIGPDSVAGLRQKRGLNENLAREILELHTLGVRTVYSQADVTNFAKVLTGWTILPTASDPDHGGEFVYLRRAHEPGSQMVVDNTYPDTGTAQGRAVLADLARHPATAKHVATKMAHHFIADDPPPALVERLTQRFLDTDGDLKEMAKALLAARSPAPSGQDQRPPNGLWRHCARPGCRRHSRSPEGWPCSASRCAPPGARTRRQRGVARRAGATARHRQHLAQRVGKAKTRRSQHGAWPLPRRPGVLAGAETSAAGADILFMALNSSGGDAGTTHARHDASSWLGGVVHLGPRASHAPKAATLAR
jgi:hypothetical protein